MKQGDIVMVPFPFTDLSSTKTRPALVISNHLLNGQNLIVCGITSQILQKHAVALTNNDLSKGALPIKSFIAVDYLSTIKKSLIKYKVGEAKSSVIKKVTASLIELIQSKA